ncbi:hypothetical protein AB0I84_18505 [Streptomyces spectabilis]|uniref:hypothetical protein n=1 Tax=Streptomyces spectabilis TaxID=68270 RepID=UPI0033FBFABD
MALPAGLTEDDTDEGGGDPYGIADPAIGRIRLCRTLCTTCVFHPGNRIQLAPGRLAQMIRDALADEGHITCHQNLPYDKAENPLPPAMCKGFRDLPAAQCRSLALRLALYLDPSTGTLHDNEEKTR